DEDVDSTVGVLPDLFAGGLFVDLRVRRVAELAGEHRVLGVRDDLLRLLDGALHTFGTGSENDFGTVGAQHHATLGGHRLVHLQDALVTAGRADHGQGDARVTGRALDNGAARLQLTGLLGGVDDGHTDAVLDAVRRVVELELRDDGRAEPLGQPVELDERCAPDQFGHIVVDPAHA